MPVGIETVYNQTQPWSSINTPTGVYKQTPDQIQKMFAAVSLARLDTPEYVIREQARPTRANAVGLGRQPTIDDVLAQTAGQAPQMSIFDYSGAPAGRIASTGPSIPVG